MIFSDAGRRHDHSQLASNAGPLIDDMATESIYLAISWSSHRAKKPVRSIGADEILAAGELIDEEKILAACIGTVNKTFILLHIVLDSHDLFLPFPTQRQSISKPLRADVSLIRFEFESRNVAEFTWIPGRLNLADVVTKAGRPVIDASQLTLADERIAAVIQPVSNTVQTGRSLD